MKVYSLNYYDGTVPSENSVWVSYDKAQQKLLELLSKKYKELESLKESDGEINSSIYYTIKISEVQGSPFG